MGGSGSGSPYHWWRGPKKEVVEHCLQLDANRWRREGILQDGILRVGTWQWTYRSGATFSVHYEVVTTEPDCPVVRLRYAWVRAATGEEDAAEYLVRLTTTRPHFGGLRWWFVCPLVADDVRCGRRVGKLYLPPGQRYFGCRTCYRLTYTSCQDSHKYEGIYRALAESLGCGGEDVKEVMRRLGKGAK